MNRSPKEPAAPPEEGGAQLDGHGRAALLLVESLIHGLASRSVLSVSEAIEIIEVAAEVEYELAHVAGHDMDGHDARSLLVPMVNSLKVDLGQ